MSGAFPNEPTGLTVTHDCSFNQILPSGVLDVYGTASYISDGTAPLSGPYVMDVALAPNATSGGVQLNGNFTGRPREVFAGFWVKTNADFEGLYLSTNKVLFIRGGDNSFLVWQGTQNAPKTLKWYQQGTVNNTHVPGVYGTNYPVDGTGWFEPNINGTVATFSAGSGWHKVEIRLRSSTTSTSRDGIIQIWVDGTLSTSHFNVNIAPGGFEDWVITPTWDGSHALTCAYRDCTKAWHWYWDHLYVSAATTSSGGAPVLSTLTPSTVSIAPGNTQVFSATMSGTVTTDTSVTLASSLPTVASVGTSAVITAGNASTNFTVTGVASGSSTISATVGSVTKSSTITVSSGSGGGSGGGTPTTYTYASQFSGVQGQDQWSYRDTNGDLLAYNAGAAKWEGSELYLAVWSSGFMHGYPSYATRGAVVRWTAPAAGTVTVTGTALLYTTPAGATFTIKLNSTTLFTQAMLVSTSYPYSLSFSVANGDAVDFILTRDTVGTNNNTQLNPVIVFTPVTTGSGSVTVSSMTPSHGDIGSSVTVVGTGFSATAVNNTITVNGVAATVTSASTTQLIFTVPNTSTGLVTITTSAGSGSAGTFTVDNPVTPDVPPASNFGGSAMLLLVLP